MKRIVLGVLAHVDAGKTTLCETILYHAGEIRRRGRVDHGDSMLDTGDMERQRGITIFSKEASFQTEDRKYYLLDTPGHVDFSTEAERTLSVLDYAILVISASEGIQNHTETLWKLLESYGVPTILFVNKMDQIGGEEVRVRAELRKFSDKIIFADEEESVALLSEDAMEGYVSEGSVPVEIKRRLLRQRRLIPCFMGSALKEEGIDLFIRQLSLLTEPREEKESFGAIVYKISHDAKGNRLSHIRITGGTLSPRNILLTGKGKEEKVTEIREYEGNKYQNTDVAESGTVCAVLGLNDTYAGEGLGTEVDASLPQCHPVMSYHIVLPSGIDSFSFLPKMKILEEEDPTLHVDYRSGTKEIFVSLMGDIQIESLTFLIRDRFGVPVTFDSGHVLYKETLQESVEGVGHYEPLRHYSEVHILLSPRTPGSGILCEVSPECEGLTPTEQRLILSHMKEEIPRGVLTGSPVEDIKMTLISGRSHEKHTEGGDFREATRRAIRQGLRKGKCLLLEPLYSFVLNVPREAVGQIMTDLRQRCGQSEITATEDMMVTLEGTIPVSEMIGYWSVLESLCKGRGKYQFNVSSYEECHEAENVIEKIAYVPENDLEHPTSSVFCERGAGFDVPWFEVDRMAHLPLRDPKHRNMEVRPSWSEVKTEMQSNEKIDEIMNREFGPIRRKEYSEPKRYGIAIKEPKQRLSKQKLYLVDGYNFIYATEPYRSLANEDLGHARACLEQTLINFLHYRNVRVILVYDGYKVKGNMGERLDKNGLKIAFTMEGETGDALMERIMAEIGKNYDVYAISSDGLIQVTAVSVGVLRISSREFAAELDETMEEIREKIASDNG